MGRINTSIKLPDFLSRQFAKDHNLLYEAKLHRQDSRKTKDSLTYSFPPFKLSVAFPWSFKVCEMAKIVPELLSYIPSLPFCMSIKVLAFTPKNVYTSNYYHYQVEHSNFLSDMGCFNWADLHLRVWSRPFHTHILHLVLIRRKWSVLCLKRKMLTGDFYIFCDDTFS